MILQKSSHDAASSRSANQLRFVWKSIFLLQISFKEAEKKSVVHRVKCMKRWRQMIWNPYFIKIIISFCIMWNEIKYFSASTHRIKFASRFHIYYILNYLTGVSVSYRQSSAFDWIHLQLIAINYINTLRIMEFVVRRLSKHLHSNHNLLVRKRIYIVRGRNSARLMSIHSSRETRRTDIELINFAGFDGNFQTDGSFSPINYMCFSHYYKFMTIDNSKFIIIPFKVPENYEFHFVAALFLFTYKSSRKPIKQYNITVLTKIKFQLLELHCLGVIYSQNNIFPQ